MLSKQTIIDRLKELSQIYSSIETDEEYFFEKESEFMVKSNYMDNQSEITPSIRFILVEWLFQVCYSRNIPHYPIYLAINMVDRYLEKSTIKKSKFQLLGITSLYIAEKYDEVHYNDISDNLYVCGNIYDRKEMLDMEKNILKTLNYSISYISPLCFLRTLLKHKNMDKNALVYCYYILDLTTLSPEMNKFKPSIISSSALMISSLLFDDISSSYKIVQNIMHYEIDDLIDCIRFQINLINEAKEKKHFIYKKYSLEEQKRISITCLEEDKMEIIKSLNKEKCINVNEIVI